MTGNRSGRHGIVLADDLIWGTRLAAVLETLGARVQRVRTVAAFEAAFGSGDVGGSDFAVVDLTARAYEPIAAIELAHSRGLRVLGVGQHDDIAQRKAALAAGAERVFAYRKLFEDGPATLQAWLHGDRPSHGAPAASRPTGPGDGAARARTVE